MNINQAIRLAKETGKPVTLSQKEMAPFFAKVAKLVEKPLREIRERRILALAGLGLVLD